MRKLLTFLIALGAVVALSVAKPVDAGVFLFVQKPTWTPAQLSGLIAWYKADNDSTNVFSDTACTVPVTTNAGSVFCWKDRSGNGYNIVNGGSGNRPTYTLAGLNGKPTVTFLYSNATVLKSAVGVAMGTGLSGSAFAIGTMNTATSSSGRLVTYAPPSAADTASGGFVYIDRQSTTAGFSSDKGGSGPGGATISYATETRFGAIASGTAFTNYVNGVVNGTPGSGSNAFISGGYIGVGQGIGSGGAPSGAYWDGNISEIIITNTAMSSGDIASLDNYLASRW